MANPPPKSRRRKRRADSRQMAFAFEDAGRPYRAIVLNEVNRSTIWRTALAISTACGITYHQAVFALIALHDNGKVARAGHKYTAKWGPLTLDRPPETNFNLLQNLFNSTVKR